MVKSLGRPAWALLRHLIWGFSPSVSSRRKRRLTCGDVFHCIPASAVVFRSPATPMRPQGYHWAPARRPVTRSGWSSGESQVERSTSPPLPNGQPRNTRLRQPVPRRSWQHAGGHVGDLNLDPLEPVGHHPTVTSDFGAPWETLDDQGVPSLADPQSICRNVLEPLPVVSDD